MRFPALSIIGLLLAVPWTGCHRQTPQESPAAARENTRLEEHIAPESYRFDLRLGNAHVEAGPAADHSIYLRRFDFKEDPTSWKVTEGSARCTAGDGVLTLETDTVVRLDSLTVSPVPGAQIHAMTVEARVTGGAGFRLAWRGEEGDFLPENETALPVEPSGSWTIHTIDTALLPGWGDRVKDIVQLRFVLPAGIHLELRSVALTQDPDPFAGKSFGQTEYPLRGGHVHALFARTPCSLEYDVAVMPQARLTTAFLHHGTGPSQFRILLKEDAGETVLAEGRSEATTMRQKVSADLSRWSGRQVRIRFEAQSDTPGGMALWCSPSMARAHPVTDTKRPLNVIWYVIDCLRASNVGAYGHGRETTPSIDAAAKEGVRFEWCFSPGTWTIDSVASFFTGLSPNAHGMYRTRMRLPGSMHLLPEILRTAGYATALFTQNPYLGERRGFVRGFDEAHQFRVRDPRSRRPATTDTYPINRAIGDYLHEHREDPFFLYVHTIEPHHPCLPPEAMRKFKQPDGSATETDLYDDCILWADTNLGHTIAKLKEEGLWNNTLLIISADHGHCFPEYDNGLSGHGEAPFLPRVRIPLVMRIPGLLPAGIAVPEHVQALDIPQTLFELLKLAPDPQFGGWSLMGLLDGSRRNEFTQRTLFPTGEKVKWQAAVTDRWFFLDNDGKEELLDLQGYTGQNTDVAQAHPDIVEQLHDASEAYRKTELNKAAHYGEDMSGGGEDNLEERRSLEALGYLGTAQSALK